MRQLRDQPIFATLQTELLDRSTWPAREGLAQAVFASIKGFYGGVWP